LVLLESYRFLFLKKNKLRKNSKDELQIINKANWIQKRHYMW